MNERVTTNSVTDITDMVTVKHRKKTRLRKGVTVAAQSTDDVTNAPTNMLTNSAINTSAFASIDTSIDPSMSDPGPNANPIPIDTKTGETMTKTGSTTNGARIGTDKPNASTLLIEDGNMSSDTATKTQDPNSSMENIRRGIWPQLRKDMKRMTHFMRKKISLSDRRNRIKEISIKQQCWEEDDEPETTSKRTSRSTSSPTTHDADKRSLSADSSHATSSSSQSANSTPVVLDDYDEDEDV